MDLMTIFIALVAGIAVGIVVSLLMRKGQAKTAGEIADALFRESEMYRKMERDEVIERIKASFGDLSLDALKKSTEHFISLAREQFSSERTLHSKELETKKSLIDQQLHRMSTELEKVSVIVNELEKDREKKFGDLSRQLEETGKRTGELIQTTNTLREALSGSRSRGQWGERMAEDVLRLAGFIENVNYVKQKAIAGSKERPDFTFFLPRNLCLNMDVKFPYDNYMRYLEAESESDRETFRKNFLKDVKSRIQEVTSRDYINPEQNTVDYVLLFIPNEQIFSFIHELDSSIIDEGIKKRVIVCSPITLFSVLAVIRAAVDNFALEQTSNKILSLLGTFKVQWKKFSDAFEILGKRIDSVHQEYDALKGTRRRQLEKPLNEIDEMRTQRGLPVAAGDDDNLIMPDDDEKT